MSEPAELKNCPFCGSDELGHGYQEPPHQGTVQCYACGGALIADTEAEAITAWNTRSQPQSSGGEPEVVRRPNFSPILEAAKQRLKQATHDTRDFYGWKFCLARQDDLQEVLGALTAYEKTMGIIAELDRKTS